MAHEESCWNGFRRHGQSTPGQAGSGTSNGYALKRGDFFTVVKWLSHHDNSWVGACLEARVVEGPFIRVREHINQLSKYHFTLDTRRVQLAPLSEEFVREVIGA